MDPNEFQMLPDDSNWASDTPDLQPLDNSADMASQLAGDQTDALFAAHPGSSDTPALLGDQHIHESATLGDHTIDASGHMDGQQLLETNSLTHDVAHGPHSEITFGALEHGHHHSGNPPADPPGDYVYVEGQRLPGHGGPSDPFGQLTSGHDHLSGGRTINFGAAGPGSGHHGPGPGEPNESGFPFPGLSERGSIHHGEPPIQFGAAAKCWYCHGTGVVWSGGQYVKCSTCGGSGLGPG